MKAVVMAGGFGTRIQPLTNSIPKPMLPILNKPMMEHILLRLKKYGITDIVVLLYFKPDIIKNYFKDGSDWGLNISYVLPDDDYGTAGAVKCAQDLLDETFIVISGDLVTDFDLGKIIEFHKNKHSKVTITLTSVENPLQFGVVITDENKKIVNFLEKPTWDEVLSDTINTGIYVIEPEILDYIPKNENFDFSKDLFPKLLKNDINLWGCEINGYWRDVGNTKSYRDAHKDILEGKVELMQCEKCINYQSAKIYKGDNVALNDTLLLNGNLIIGNNVSFENNVELENCVIGDNVFIDDDVTLKNCIIWNDSIINRGCTIYNGVICNNNRIGKGVVAKQGVIIAENCEVEDFVSFEKDVTVWPDKVIEEGSLVSNNIVWGNRYKNSIFEESKIKGKTNAELSCELSLKIAEAFAATLPVGSHVFMSRDYKNSSRMLKRVFHGGLLSSGVNVIDLHILPSVVIQYILRFYKDVVAGLHFRQSPNNPLESDILFFTGDGIPISPIAEKSCERIFFRESFRRIEPQNIGRTTEMFDSEDRYVENFIKTINANILKRKKAKIVADVMFSSISDIYPRILNNLGIKSIVTSAYRDDRKLSNIPLHTKESQKELSTIIQSLNYDAGFMIFPSGRRLKVLCDDGVPLRDHIALSAFLYLINMYNEDKKVFLSFDSPDYYEDTFKNIEFSRGKIRNLTVDEIENYYLIANANGNYTFTEFGYSMDALYASVKLLEMLKEHDLKLSDIIKKIHKFYYKTRRINVPAAKKGKIMRLFVEDVQGRKLSHMDGIKAWLGEKEWILVKPESYDDFVVISVQAKDDERGESIMEEYTEKISRWVI